MRVDGWQKKKSFAIVLGNHRGNSVVCTTQYVPSMNSALNVLSGEI
jgi:hypothetical protein